MRIKTYLTGLALVAASYACGDEHNRTCIQDNREVSCEEFDMGPSMPMREDNTAGTSAPDFGNAPHDAGTLDAMLAPAITKIDSGMPAEPDAAYIGDAEVTYSADANVAEELECPEDLLDLICDKDGYKARVALDSDDQDAISLVFSKLGPGFNQKCNEAYGTAGTLDGEFDNTDFPLWGYNLIMADNGSNDIIDRVEALEGPAYDDRGCTMRKIPDTDDGFVIRGFIKYKQGEEDKLLDNF